MKFNAILTSYSTILMSFYAIFCLPREMCRLLSHWVPFLINFLSGIREIRGLNLRNLRIGFSAKQSQFGE